MGSEWSYNLFPVGPMEEKDIIAQVGYLSLNTVSPPLDCLIFSLCSR